MMEGLHLGNTDACVGRQPTLHVPSSSLGTAIPHIKSKLTEPAFTAT